MKLYQKNIYYNENSEVIEIVYCFKDEQGNIHKVGIHEEDLLLSESEQITKAIELIKDNLQ
jgi:hypothetical protein